ncbi:MAG TPA: type I restriction enzyme HsdR N-terminal domain-containing protein [Saprospiraceae bacterium]|nr:type I restriction enzyme HsdR N-terminal domain-containing protein [Saprospiraceae bacterium]HMQ84947.1 type I restriction enzyme HsdR N-terminal domain-containing protein [Saprospiraceae bacterium]
MKLDLHLAIYTPHLKIKKEADKRYIFDPLRKKWLVLQPEEMVRQLMIQYLIQEKNFSPNLISIERGLQVNERAKRFDLLIYNADFKPFMLVECKAPQVRIDNSAFEQAAWYNMPLRVKYLLVTNAMDSYCCQIDYEMRTFAYLESIPEKP